MLPQQKRVFRAFFGVILAVNVWGALPSIYKMPHRFIDHSTAAVYEPIETAPLIPVKRIETSRLAQEPAKIIDTGKAVAVTVRSDYQDEGRQHLAVTTLLLAVVGLGFSTWTGKQQTATA